MYYPKIVYLSEEFYIKEVGRGFFATENKKAAMRFKRLPDAYYGLARAIKGIGVEKDSKVLGRIKAFKISEEIEEEEANE